MRRFFTAPLLVLVAGLALTIAAPTASALRMPTTGDRISLFAPPGSFPANTPFHVNHGWGCDTPPTGCLEAGTRFELLVDGRDVPAAHDLEYDPHASLATEADVSNFRSGLPAGVHTFEGRWYLDGVLQLDMTVEITFV
jgi:hypothetical protein